MKFATDFGDATVTWSLYDLHVDGDKAMHISGKNSSNNSKEQLYVVNSMFLCAAII